MKVAEVAAHDGQVAVVTITAPVGGGRGVKYRVETSVHTGRVQHGSKGLSVNDPTTGRMIVATMDAYVDSIEPV